MVADCSVSGHSFIIDTYMNMIEADCDRDILINEWNVTIKTNGLDITSCFTNISGLCCTCGI